MGKTKKFEGSLGEALEPLEPLKYGLLKDVISERQEMDRAQEIKRRYELLFEHYGLAFGDWPALAGALAREFVPGLQEKKRKRRTKKKWGETGYSELLHSFEELKSEFPHSTDVKILDRLARKNPRYQSEKIPSLQIRLSEARRHRGEQQKQLRRIAEFYREIGLEPPDFLQNSKSEIS